MVKYGGIRPAKIPGAHQMSNHTLKWHKERIDYLREKLAQDRRQLAEYERQYKIAKDAGLKRFDRRLII